MFGRYLVSNPGLPYRLKNHITLADHDRETFYTLGSLEGYIEYPLSKGLCHDSERGD